MDRWGTIVSVTSDVQLNSEAFYVRDGESVDGSFPDRAIDRDDSAFSRVLGSAMGSEA